MPDVTDESNGEVLDKPAASKLIGISTRTLDGWMRKRIIPFCKLPSGTVRFRRSQLLAWLDRFNMMEGAK